MTRANPIPMNPIPFVVSMSWTRSSNRGHWLGDSACAPMRVICKCCEVLANSTSKGVVCFESVAYVYEMHAIQFFNVPISFRFEPLSLIGVFPETVGQVIRLERPTFCYASFHLDMCFQAMWNALQHSAGRPSCTLSVESSFSLLLVAPHAIHRTAPLT